MMHNSRLNFHSVFLDTLYKAEEKNKVQRKVIRGRKKRKGDKNEVEEGKTYAACSFCVHFDEIYLFKCNLFVFKSYPATLNSIFSKCHFTEVGTLSHSILVQI
jgi:hypothetical protein